MTTKDERRARYAAALASARLDAILAVADDEIRAALTAEADWLDKAHARSADLEYTQEQRTGFGWAAGWVRFHANHPEHRRIP